MTSVRMRDYELVMILSPEATEAEAAETVSRITSLISDGGGSVSEQDNWGIRRLAYPIQRFIEGNYFIARCKMEAQAAVELDTTLNTSQDVLRHLVFRLDQSDLAAMEKQAERERAARQEAERREAAEREAREREEARRLAEAEAEAQAAEGGESAAPEEAEAEEATPVQAEASAEPEATPVEAEASAEPEAAPVEAEASAEAEAAPVEAEASAEPEVEEAAPVEAEASAEPSEGETPNEDESKEGQ